MRELQGLLASCSSQKDGAGRAGERFGPTVTCRVGDSWGAAGALGMVLALAAECVCFVFCIAKQPHFERL